MTTTFSILRSDRDRNEADNAYQLFLDSYNHKNRLFYYSLEFRELLIRTLNCSAIYLTALDLSGNPIGILPLCYKRSSLGVVYNSLPFFGPNGGILTSDHSRSSLIHRMILEYLQLEILKSDFVSCVIYQPLFSSNSEDYLLALKPDYVESRETLVTNLLSELTFNKKLNWDIRKANSFGFQITSKYSESDWYQFIEMLEESETERGIPNKPKRFYEELNLLLSSRSDLAKIYLVKLEQEVISGLIVLLSPNVVSYYSPAVKSKYRSTQALTGLIFHAMQDQKKQGREIWNWERSPDINTGVYNFKKKWGSISFPYSLYVKLNPDIPISIDDAKKLLKEESQFFYIRPIN